MKGKLEADEYWKDQLLSEINDLKHSNYAKLGKEVNKKLEEFGVENEELYYLVNRDLAIKVAKRAKEAGVKQFIFMKKRL